MAIILDADVLIRAEKERLLRCHRRGDGAFARERCGDV